MNIFAGKALDYLIEIDNAKALAVGRITESGYETTEPPGGIFIWYGNVRDQEKNQAYGPYLEWSKHDDIGAPEPKGYGEWLPDPDSEGFRRLITSQIARAKQYGAQAIEWDNIDSLTVAQALKVFEWTHAAGLLVAVKNPWIVKRGGDRADLLRHPAAALAIIETGAGDVAENHELRVLAGKPDFPLRFVAYGDDLDDALQRANEAANYIDVGVSFSAKGEYGSSRQLALPRLRQSTMPAVTGADILAKAKTFIGKLNDGPDVPMMAQAIAKAYPTMAAYSALAKNDTAWCAIFIAYVCTLLGIRPPYVKNSSDTDDFMWADAPLEAGWGKVVSRAQAQPGDVMVLRSPHHQTLFDGNDGADHFWGVGGNQGSGVVSRARFAWSGVRAVVRPPVASLAPVDPVAGIDPKTAPLLKYGSVGPYVQEAQRLLISHGYPVGSAGADGEIGDDTDAAIRAFQAAKGLDVDGEIGEQTWTALLGKPVPKPVDPGALPASVIAEIISLARLDPIARYSWPGRGVAPVGYTCGMAVAFAVAHRALRAGKSWALAMVQPLGARDALAHYGNIQPTLPNVFGFLLGLGMRESSGNYTEGRDPGADNVTSDTAEAGLFQQSWNSHTASPEIGKLLANPPAQCFAEIFREGITVKSTDNFGSGDGLKFQMLAKSCPAFAVECAGVGIRVLYDHWGPIVRREVTFSNAAVAMFQKVATLVDVLMPIDGDVIEPGDEPDEPPPPAEPIDRTTLVLLAMLLVLLKEQDMSNVPGLTQADLDRALALVLAKLQAPQQPALVPPAQTVVPAAAAPADLSALLALILSRLAPQSEPQKPPPEPEPKPHPAPVPNPTPGTQKPSVQLSILTLAIGAVLQYLGVVGTPFGMGQTPTDTGTAITLAPLLTALVGATGAFGSFGRGLASFLTKVGEYAAKYQPKQ